MPIASRLAAACMAAALLFVGGCAPDEQAPEAGAPKGTTPIAGTAPKPFSSDAPARTSVPQGSGFDFYVLSLSWSPSYCEAEGESANEQQCRRGRPYAFVVHGLWPQYERGYPRDCDSGGRDLPKDLVSSLYDIMPASGLIRHEWRTHGTCSGLSQADYFSVLRKAREAVTIPQEFRRLTDWRTVDPDDAERAFLSSNPGLEPGDIAVTCDRRYLREVRICMTKELSFRPCPEIDRDACRAAKVVMPPVRGG